MTDLVVPTRAITLTEPWATLVALNAKMIETRSWPTRHRGPIAIHAAKGFPLEAMRFCSMEPFLSVLERAGYQGPADLPTGKIVAIANLEHCYRFADDSHAAVVAESRRGTYPAHESLFGDFTAGRFGFVLTNVIRLRAPVAARGFQGIWPLQPGERVQLATALRLQEAA